MRTGSAPMPLMPRAVASRRAGSTVSTRTRLSSAAAIAMPSAALTVVLPTPPLPAQITTSSDAEPAPEPGRLPCEHSGAARGRARPVRAHASRAAERVGDGARGRQAGPIDDERDRDHRHRQLAAELARVAGGCVVQVRLEIEAGLERMPASRPGARRPPSACSGSMSALMSRRCAAVTGSSIARFSTHTSTATPDPLRRRSCSSIASVDRHLLGERAQHDGRAARVTDEGRRSTRPARGSCRHCTSVSIAFGAARCDSTWPPAAQSTRMRSQTGVVRSGLLAALLVRDLADHEHVARPRDTRSR